LEVYEFASVTYCTNIPAGESPSDNEAEYVASQVAELFDSKLRESSFADELVVVRAEYRVGCILTTLTIGATATALYKFVKNYSKFRPGLLLLLKDINGVYVRLKGSLNSGSTYIMRDDLPDQKELEVLSEKVKAGANEPAKVKKRLTKET
jgi:hypothetical protein